MEQYKDSPAVEARRAELDARGAEFGRRGVDLRPTIGGVRTKASLEYIINKLGDQDEFELFFLDMLDATYDKMTADINAAVVRSRLALPDQ